MKQAKLVSVCQRMFGVRGTEIAIGLMRVQWTKIIDSIMTIGCLIGIVLLTRSLGAFFLATTFGLWNYWRGLKDQANTVVKPESETTVISRGLIERVKNLPPGSSLHCTSARDQVDFVVIETSDFDHIIEQAGLTIKKEKRNG